MSLMLQIIHVHVHLIIPETLAKYVNIPLYFDKLSPNNFKYSVNQCVNNPCLNNGTCQQTKDGFNCICPLYYYGSNCQTCAKFIMNLNFNLNFYSFEIFK